MTAIRQIVGVCVQVLGTVIFGTVLAGWAAESSTWELITNAGEPTLGPRVLGCMAFLVGGLLAGGIGRFCVGSSGYIGSHIAAGCLGCYLIFQVLGDIGHPARFGWNLTMGIAAIVGMYAGFWFAQQLIRSE